LQKEEYEDEEVLATVTVVEDFDPDRVIHGPRIKKEPAPPPLINDPPPTTIKPKRDKSNNKVKAKKVRYGTKEARKAERTKQKTRRTEKAELAGGKAARRRRRGPGGRAKRAGAMR
jgi:hypothetical protein